MVHPRRRSIAGRVLHGALLGDLSLALASAAANANVSLKPILISSYTGFLNLSAPAAGYLVGIEALMTAAVTALAVRCLDRVGQRRMLLGSGLVIVAGNLVSIGAGSFTSLAIGRILSGSGHGAMQSLCAMAIAVSSHPERLSGGIAILVSLFAMGLMFLIPWLQSIDGVGAVFVAMACTVALALPFVRQLPLRRRDATSTNLSGKEIARATLSRRAATPASSSGSEAGVATHSNHGLTSAPRWQVAVSLAAAAAFYLSIGSFWPFATEFGKQAGLDYVHAGRAAGWAYFAALFGAFAVMIVGRRAGRLPALVGAVACSLAAQLALLHSPQSVPVYLVSIVTVMFCWGVFYPVFLGLASELDPSGRMNGYTYALGLIGFALGPTLASAIMSIGHPGYPTLTTLLWLSSGCLLPAFLIALPVLAAERAPGASLA